MAWYTASYLRAKAGLPPLRSKPGVMDGVFPSRLEEIPVLEYAVQSRPDDATARLLLGHLRFHLGQTDAARKLWEDSARINPSSSVASRALGVTAWKLDGDLAQAERYLRQALSADPRDGIVGRDLALVLQAAAAKDVEQEKPLFMKSKEVLETVLPHNKHRADVVEMLARLYNRLGELDKAAELLDGIYVTAWEGAQGLHDMYRAAHLGLGKRHFEAARFEEAAGEFRRALEYPENLGIGRREGAEEADLYYWLGMALSRAGENDNARAAWKRAAEESPSRNAEIERCRKLAQDALNEPQ
jgi:tetratricopeptide (TPR) repeat protein